MLAINAKTTGRQRRGAITVLSAFFMVALVGMVAFAIDLGYLMSGREELQRSADAAALAAVWEYAKQSVEQNSSTTALNMARMEGSSVAFENDVCKHGPLVDLNSGNAEDGDIVVGTITDFTTPNPPMSFDDPDEFNAVRVRVQRTNDRNGKIPFFFAKIFGRDGQETDAFATAAMVKHIKGFTAPSNGDTLDLLPFALDQQTWLALEAGSGSDNWGYDEQSKQVFWGPDGVLECNLYPQGTGSPGNRGTVDIGPSNNSTNDIARQILHGVSAADMAAIGGSIEFNSTGYVILNGDTGISAGVKDELAAIRGHRRIIPVFSHVVGPGNNADFYIVKWVGVRIMEVKLTGSKNVKRLIVQPAPVETMGVIPGESQSYTEYVYSPAFLVN